VYTPAGAGGGVRAGIARSGSNRFGAAAASIAARAGVFPCIGHELLEHFLEKFITLQVYE
jgi:hypothetical protein